MVKNIDSYVPGPSPGLGCLENSCRGRRLLTIGSLLWGHEAPTVPMLSLSPYQLVLKEVSSLRCWVVRCSSYHFQPTDRVFSHTKQGPGYLAALISGSGLATAVLQATCVESAPPATAMHELFSVRAAIKRGSTGCCTSWHLYSLPAWFSLRCMQHSGTIETTTAATYLPAPALPPPPVSAAAAAALQLLL